MSKQRLKDNWTKERTAITASLGLLLIGVIGYFAVSRDSWLFLTFSHLGALGLLGLMAVASGTLAKRKHRGFNAAFLIGVVIPATAGIASVAVYNLKTAGGIACGGIVSLPVALVVVGIYAFIRPGAGLVSQRYE
jgi:hypothetical protein